MDYSNFFSRACGNDPFDFQERFREQIATSKILKAPTGLGKTDTVLLAWMHWRLTAPAEAPRRLIWCLPGRALTEQVAKVAEERICTLTDAGILDRSIPVYRLLGGSVDNDVRLQPHQEGVLVGTQDLLLSRALNRGYARSPFRWPIDFALLNNDCYWVLDEVQLLGDGLATSLQLAAFREHFGVFGRAASCWISATIDPAWMDTADFRGGAIEVIEPGAEDRQNPKVAQRIEAEKLLARAPLSCRMPTGAAELVAKEHLAGTLSLVVTNTVRRAVEIRDELAKKKVQAEVRLLHSRFRAADRASHLEMITSELPAEGRIVIATQVIEAGIDLDASLMVTDLAPYASMVQRFGRVNRKGERKGCRIYWVDRPLTSKTKALAEAPTIAERDLDKVWAPYDPTEIKASEALFADLISAAPDDLPRIHGSPNPWQHVLRRADLLDLFDTSSDLGGNQIDISRFVRSDPERDVYVAWRMWEPAAGAPAQMEIDDAELCPAPIDDIKKDGKKLNAWVWNAVAEEWQHPESFYPGMTLVLHSTAGKYTTESGWSPDSKAPVTPVEPGKATIDRADDDRRSFFKFDQSLEDHTEQVCAAMKALLFGLQGIGVNEFRSELEVAARHHDWGKAHEIMQRTLHAGADGPYAVVLAKSATGGKHKVPHFRHELASGLAMIAAGETDLAAYVAAAHHGRIRVVVRSMPGERVGKEVRVRGIADGEMLAACSLGSGVLRPETRVKLDQTLLGFGPDGSPSWTERVLRLRDDLGPFRLALLEALLRSADEIASARAEQEASK